MNKHYYINNNSNSNNSNSVYTSNQLKDKKIHELEQIISKLEKENNELKLKLKQNDEIIIKKNKEISELEKFKRLQSSSINNYPTSIPIEDEEAAILESLVEFQLQDPIKEYEDNLIRELCPDPDHMTYDQIIEMQEKIGFVSRGLSKSQISKLGKMKYNPKMIKENR